MISETEIEARLNYLADTDIDIAKASTKVKMLEHKLKTTKAIVMLESTGTDRIKESRALVSTAYCKVLDELDNANLDYEIMKTKRRTAELFIDCWRTQESSRRQGKI